MLNISPAITAYILFVTTILGLVFGSFFNAWAWRIVHHESVAKGRSHCAVCSHVLGARDLIPLFSYLFLKGKCRFCGTKISPRYPLVELICGLMFVSTVLRWDVGLVTLRFIILGAMLLVLSLVDLDTREIPDGLLIVAAVAALLRYPVEGMPGLKSALIGAVVIGGAMLLIVLIFDKIMGRETMGGGDIKLFAVLGLHFGVAQMVFLLITACIIGLIFAFVLKQREGRIESAPEAECVEKEEGFPFGPSISIAAWITILFGSQVLGWYLGTFF